MEDLRTLPDRSGDRERTAAEGQHGTDRPEIPATDSPTQITGCLCGSIWGTCGRRNRRK